MGAGLWVMPGPAPLLWGGRRGEQRQNHTVFRLVYEVNLWSPKIYENTVLVSMSDMLFCELDESEKPCVTIEMYTNAKTVLQ